MISEEKDKNNTIERREKRFVQDKVLFEDSLEKLSLTASDSKVPFYTPTNVDSDKIYEAFKIVIKYFGSQFKAKPELPEDLTVDDKIRILCTNSNIRGRKVSLKDKWWKSVFSPLLCFHKIEKTPLVLVPVKRQYVVYDMSDGKNFILNADTVARLDNSAFTFYKLFPNGKLSSQDIFKFILDKNYIDITGIIFIALLASIIGLIIPIATGVIFDTIIPEAERFRLIQAALVIFSSAIAVTLLSLFKSIAYIRFSTKVNYCLQSALWDRVLKLPVTFFRKFTAGDLVQRSLSINIMRDMLSNIVITSIVNGIFSVVYLILLFYYSSSLALVCLSLVAVFVLFISIMSFLMLRYQKKIIAFESDITGFVLQLISGIAKIKISGAEKRVFSRWTDIFCRKKRLEMKSAKVSTSASIFTSLFPYISSMIIFSWIVFKLTDGTIPPGSYMAFNTAFIALLLALTQMSSSLIPTIAVFERYKRLKPILEEEPEVNNKIIPSRFTGKIELNKVYFKYGPKEPEILKKISIKIDKGNFIAIVGNSGCGKSTLVRLLLGFEKPQSGTIYYDNYDLSTIELIETRRQIGVVLQNGNLVHGTIFRNIALAANINMQQAWEAAALANIDKDIEAMPMGMNTLLEAGGYTISGGQRQRIMIARALAKKPSILILDEATTSLDNLSQHIIKETIDKLSITRIVIAHRLSTIINADTIYFIKDGIISEKGTYNELMESKGCFFKFAERQIL